VNLACHLHTSALAALAPVHSEAVKIVQNLEKDNALDTKKDWAHSRPATKAIVKQPAKAITDLLQCCLRAHPLYLHYTDSCQKGKNYFCPNRQDVKKRLKLSNVIKDVRCIIIHLGNQLIGSTNAMEDRVSLKIKPTQTVVQWQPLYSHFWPKTE